VPQDYRGVVDRVMADSPPGSMILSLGMWGISPAPRYVVDGIDYYLWLRRSPIRIVDGSLLDEYTATHITNPDAIVWGVVELPWPLPPEQVQRAGELGVEIIPFENLVLLRQRAPTGTPAEQIDALLNWGRLMEPGLTATRSLLNPQFGASALGDNVLPALGNVRIETHSPNLLNEEPLGSWVLWPGTSQGQDAKSFVLSSDGSQPVVKITLSTPRLIPDKDYVLLFHYRNKELKGERHVSLSVYSSDWKMIDTFPRGGEYLCPPGLESASAYAFHVPAAASNAILSLEITGTGTAEFSSIEMRPMK